MAKIEHYYTQFENGKYYHIFNRTVDRKPMFTKAENYSFFLKQFDKYISKYVKVYAYCLLDNHFHMLIKINELEDLTTFIKLSNLKIKSTHDIISHQFRKFFQSYAMAFNKQENRIGTLFQTPFKRVKIKSENKVKEIICYIHLNPAIHSLITNFEKWKWSSYPSILAKNETKNETAYILRIFQGSENYKLKHKEYLEIMKLGEKDFYIED